MPEALQPRLVKVSTCIWRTAVCLAVKTTLGRRMDLDSLYFLLLTKERCAKWTAAVRREAWQPKKSMRTCNEHFITGGLTRVG